MRAACAEPDFVSMVKAIYICEACSAGFPIASSRLTVLSSAKILESGWLAVRFYSGRADFSSIHIIRSKLYVYLCTLMCVYVKIRHYSGDGTGN